MKKLMTVLLGMCMVLSLFGCGSQNVKTTDNQINEKRTVRICYSGVYVDATSMVMAKEGILDKYLPENVTVEWKEIASGPDIRDALVSENVDIADFSLMTFLTSKENDLPIKIISYSGSTPIYLYSHTKNIEKLEDFESNDSISITNKNTNLHIAFLALCEKNLGNALELDANLSPIPAADALASLETSNDYQGAIFSFPMSKKADNINNLYKIEDMTDLIKEYGVGSVMVTRNEYYENNSDIIEAFRQAQEETIAFIVNNPEKAAEDLYEHYGCTKEDVVDAIQNMPPTNVVSGYDKQAQLLYEAGILTKKPQLFEELDNYDEIPHE